MVPRILPYSARISLKSLSSSNSRCGSVEVVDPGVFWGEVGLSTTFFLPGMAIRLKIGTRVLRLKRTRARMASPRFLLPVADRGSITDGVGGASSF